MTMFNKDMRRIYTPYFVKLTDPVRYVNLDNVLMVEQRPNGGAILWRGTKNREDRIGHDEYAKVMTYIDGIIAERGKFIAGAGEGSSGESVQ